MVSAPPNAPARAPVLAVSSNKGGVGKTTVAANLAIFIRALREDLPVLVVGLDDPNRVKVVLDRNDLALYFSRSRIPALRDAKSTPRYWQHVGLYAYRRPFLLDFVKLQRTPLELAEALEQLRALENGYRIRCGKVENWLGIPVDVPSDVARVEARLEETGRC